MADDDVRRIAMDAAGDIPDDTPMEAILARAQRRRTTRWVTSALASVVLLAVAAVAVAVPGQRVELAPADPPPQPTPGPTVDASPAPGDDPTSQPSDGDDDGDADPPDASEEAVEVRVTLFAVRDPFWLEPIPVTVDAPGMAVGRAAMEALIAAEPDDPEVTNLVPADAEVRDINLRDGVLIVDFAGLSGLGLGAAYEGALIDQIVHTGTALSGVDAVEILLDGQRGGSVAGHIMLEGPIEADPHRVVPLTVTAPERVDVPGRITISGDGCVLDRIVELTLIAPDGRAASDELTLVSRCPRRVAWDHVIELDTPGVWTLRAEVSTGTPQPTPDGFVVEVEIDVLAARTEVPGEREEGQPLFIGEECAPETPRELPSGAPPGQGRDVTTPLMEDGVLGVGAPAGAWGPEEGPDAVVQRVGRVEGSFSPGPGPLEVVEEPIATYGTGDVIAEGPIEGPDGERRHIVMVNALGTMRIDEVRDGCPVTTILHADVGLEGAVDYARRF